MGELAIAAGISAIVGAGTTAITSEQQRRAGREAQRFSQFQAAATFGQIKNARNRDILALRRSPGFQAFGTSLLSQFTNLNEQQASSLLQSRAASADPFTETQTPQPSGPFQGFGSRQDQSRAINLESELSQLRQGGLSVGEAERTRDILNELQTLRSQAGLAPTGSGAINPFEAAGISGPVTLQNTDIISRELLESIRSQEQQQVAGLITQNNLAASQAEASRGFTGAIGGQALNQATQQQLFSGVAARSSARELQAAQANRAGLLDIFSLFEEFAAAEAGSFT